MQNLLMVAASGAVQCNPSCLLAGGSYAIGSYIDLYIFQFKLVYEYIPGKN